MIFYDNTYYKQPMQVIFVRPDKVGLPVYEKGIVFRSHVIAAKDGAAFSIKKICRYAHKHGVDTDYAIVERFGWQAFNID
jgi:hypothetical protein